MVVADECMSACGTSYWLPEAEPILGPKMCLGSEVGLSSQLHSPPSGFAFQWMLCFAIWERCMRNSVRFGLEIICMSHVMCWLIVPVWREVVSVLL